ncbi:MAG TPA: glycerophosphodiester phosphodiesterase family protein [Gemmatimonadaceae bacterium]|nr:glycerophosphodiester phosphodiesterase family protein [Gemmatimonadaceae bacterium]
MPISNALTTLDGRFVIGHRGNARLAPENTLESFRQAAALGVDAIELDVRLTRDGVPVVIHDPTLGRTTDRGDAVADISLARLRRADAGAMFTPDAGASFPYRGRGLTIPTLRDVLDVTHGIPLLIEVKVPGAGPAIVDELRQANASGRVVAASMQSDAVLPLREARIATGATAMDVLALWSRLIGGHPTQSLPYAALCIPRVYVALPLPVRGLARMAKEALVTTHVWTVDEPHVAQKLWRSGVQGIVTNDPATMLRARAQLAGGG